MTVAATAKRAARAIGLRRGTVASARLAGERHALALLHAGLTPGPFPWKRKASFGAAIGGRMPGSIAGGATSPLSPPLKGEGNDGEAASTEEGATYPWRPCGTPVPSPEGKGIEACRTPTELPSRRLGSTQPLAASTVPLRLGEGQAVRRAGAARPGWGTGGASAHRAPHGRLPFSRPAEGTGDGRIHGRLRPRILCYHSVGTPAWGVNDVTPVRFRRQIETLIARGYRFRDAADVARNGRPGEIAITFDDGLASVARNAAPLLFDLGIPWTLFVVSEWADGRHPFGEGVMLGWREIERLAQRGATIASHSATHADFGRLTREQARAELVASRAALRDRLGIDADAFAIPLGCRRNWSAAAAEEARAAGYTTIYAQGEARRSPGTAGRTFITRFDNDRLFSAALAGAFDRWEEWV